MDLILQSYLYTALWSSTGDNEECLDANYSVDDFSPEAISLAEIDIALFFALAKELIVDDVETTVAHDFWLTRNGHGAGFWDGDYEHGDELTEICKQFKEQTPYAGDDGKIYFM